MEYRPPVRDMQFVLRHIAGMDGLAAFPAYQHATADVVSAVLEEASKLAGEVWAPTNVTGDRQTSRLEGDTVKTPDGFKEAYTKFAEGGWNALVCAEAHGGQNLPWALGMAVNEMWQSSNLALGLCPLLTQAAIEAIEKWGAEEHKKTYLEKLVSGAWTGTMQLTEPQAGTDLAAIRTTAKKNGDHYLLKGQKIFITYGEHGFVPNIIHLVLAHIDGLPDGNDGLGLFIVPKFLVNAGGSLGKRNDAHAVSLEHKLGIHGSPTCVMMYGENEGATGYLIGGEGNGLKCMFTMMNNARISVGLQGVALAERAYQHALAYAKERVQGFKLGDKSGKRVAIIEHADVRRMLLTMRATTEASRALSYYAGSMIDRMRHEKDDEVKKLAAARVDLLTPLVKAWSTDLAVETASLGIQVHGGMGFIEETGAAQYYRDARILPIYEGTNGIQSKDLVFRKVLRDGGAEAKRFIGEMKDFCIGNAAMEGALQALEETTAWLLANAKSDLETVSAAAVPYLRIFATVAGGYMMEKMAKAAEVDDYKEKIVIAQFFREAILPQVHGLVGPVKGGQRAVSVWGA